MRRFASLLAVLLASFSVGCGGSDKDGATLPADLLDHDASSAFGGRWYGTASGTVRGYTGPQPPPGAAELQVTVGGRNAVVLEEFCPDGSGPPARVTSDSTFVVGSHSCPLPMDGCDATVTVRGGNGTLSAGALEVRLDTAVTGCGNPAMEMDVTFRGTRERRLDPGFDQGPPVARVDPAVASALPGAAVVLDAGASSDPDGRTLTFSWHVVSQPGGGDARIDGASSARATFRATVEGTYSLNVLVTAADGQTALGTVTVEVTQPGEPIAALPHGVVDAEYSRALDRLVMTDSGPDALYVLDPVGGGESAVALPLPPRCLSVSPDGRRALVGHDAWITLVDLAGARVERTIPVGIDVAACTLASGWAYVFSGTSWRPVHSVELATGVETGNTTNVYDGSRGVLAPDGRTLYAVSAENLSPMDLFRWDVSGGVASFAYEMAYHGEYEVGARIWMEGSGARIFTSAGTAFRTAPAQSQDMTYAGRLSGLSAVTHLDLSAGEIAAIPALRRWETSPAPVDTAVELFEPSYLGHIGRIALPRWAVGGRSFATHGRFVFYGADGTRKFVIVQADVAAGLSRDTAVLTF